MKTMKTEIILGKSWIQTPKVEYGNRFDEFLTFFWKGVGYTILCFFWRGRILVNKTKKVFFGQHFHEMGRRKAPRVHI